MREEDLAKLREFNRFIGVKLHVFARYAFGTSYSLVEGRIVGEIGRNENCSANEVAALLNIDKSYLSRILVRLESDAIILRMRSDEDSRKKILSLTDKGRLLYDEFDALSNSQAENMLSGLGEQEISKLLGCMDCIQSILE